MSHSSQTPCITKLKTTAPWPSIPLPPQSHNHRSLFHSNPNPSPQPTTTDPSSTTTQTHPPQPTTIDPHQWPHPRQPTPTLMTQKATHDIPKPNIKPTATHDHTRSTSEDPNRKVGLGLKLRQSTLVLIGTLQCQSEREWWWWPCGLRWGSIWQLHDCFPWLSLGEKILKIKWEVRRRRRKLWESLWKHVKLFGFCYKRWGIVTWFFCMCNTKQKFRTTYQTQNWIKNMFTKLVWKQLQNTNFFSKITSNQFWRYILKTFKI